MTRIEELSKLLVEELNDFNKGIEKLGKINEELKTTKIKMDLTEYKSIIESHQNQMDKHQKAIEQFEERFNKKIREAKIYPNWAVVIFIVCVVVSVVLAAYVVIK
ncbi:DUF6730 family protein [Snuella lapsa]|uniref:Uncharacterized protein n=1 Tax=Snuella lapsa TaxID=870481 RepID=A0ABP6X3M9_9FLAO